MAHYFTIHSIMTNISLQACTRMEEIDSCSSTYQMTLVITPATYGHDRLRSILSCPENTSLNSLTCSWKHSLVLQLSGISGTQRPTPSIRPTTCDTNLREFTNLEYFKVITSLSYPHPQLPPLNQRWLKAKRPFVRLFFFFSRTLLIHRSCCVVFTRCSMKRDFRREMDSGMMG